LLKELKVVEKWTLFETDDIGTGSPPNVAKFLRPPNLSRESSPYDLG
jgi:hypothetical protein